MAQEHSNGVPQRRVTKSEACEALGVSLSTLDRRISEGQYEVERVQQGQVQRVFVLLPGDTARPREAEPEPATELVELRERVAGLEALLEERGRRLAEADERYQHQRVDHEAEVGRLLRALPAPSAPPAPGAPSRPWWKVWA